jgi:sporulation protein YlmC with PRC-barrel domain
MEIRSTSLPISETIPETAVLGRKVLGKNGEKIGDVAGLYIDPKKLNIEGIRVDKGVFKFDHYIGNNYIETISDKGVILNITPLDEFVGKRVIDSAGKELGKVKQIKRIGPTNEPISFVISRGIGKDDLVLKEDQVKEMGEAIMLNVEIQE